MSRLHRPPVAVIVILLSLLLMVSSPAWAGDEVLRVQERLAEEGYDPGPIDGIMGPSTRSAIRDFQRDRNLSATGRLDDATLEALDLEFRTVEVPANIQIQVRLSDRLDSGESYEGESFGMTVSDPVIIGDQTAIPAGAVVRGTVAEVESARRPQKSGRMVLVPTSVLVRGETILIDGVITADEGRLEGEGSLKDDLKKIGIGAGIGAAIGGILKGGKGALAGLLIGGGGTFLGTKGEQVELEAETPLVVKLEKPVVVPLTE